MRRTLPRFLTIAVLALIACASVATLHAGEVEASEGELIKTLKKDDATWQEIDQACRDLRRIGTRECIPALADLLSNERYSHMARYALEPMPYPEVDRALRNALGKTEGEIKVGIINSLRTREDQKAVPELTALLQSDNDRVAGAAALALGQIATDDAVNALEEFRSTVSEGLRAIAGEASLTAAEHMVERGEADAAVDIYNDLGTRKWPQHVRSGAFVGLLNAQPDRAVARVIDAISGKDPQLKALAIANAGRLKGKNAVEKIAAEMPELSADDQVVLIEGLAERGGPDVGDALLEVGKSSSGKVRTAAVRALGDVGDEQCVAWLAEIATTGETAEQRKAASNSLVRIEGDGVTARLTELMAEMDAETRPKLITVLMQRNDPAAVDALLEQAGAADADVRGAAFKALGKLAEPAHLPKMVDLLVASPDDAARDAAEKAVAAVAGQISSEKKRADAVLAALEDAQDVADRCSLLSTLSGIGGQQALGTVRENLKSQNDRVRDAAVRALSAWPEPDAARALLDVFRNSDNATHRTLALRGLVRVLDLPSDLSPAIIADLYAQASAGARNPAERRLLLSGLMSVAHPMALDLAAGWIDDKNVGREATTAALKIAESILAWHRDAAKAGLQKIASATENDDVRQQARQLIQRADQFEDYIVAWQVAGPYSKGGTSASQLMGEPFPPETDEPARWQALPPRGRTNQPWMLDLDSTVGGTQCVAYVKTWVRSDSARQARLELGFDDGIKAWLNGENVHTNNTSGAAKPGEDKVKVSLKKGWNSLMLKVKQHTSAWEFCARLRTPEGKVLDDIEVDPTHGETQVAEEGGGEWTAIFNGKDLSGWTETGDAIFKVEDGHLIGTQTNGKGGDLWTEKEWADFELRATYRVVWPANSGFWFRHDGKKGYQYDVLKWPNPVAYSGSLYCPGKLFITRNLNESLENRDGWNDARVRADGTELTQWLNGVKVGQVRDDTLSKGKVGIQVHPGEKFKGMKIIIKSLEIRPL